MSFTRVALGECCDIVGGGTPRTSDPGLWGGDVVWATPKDLSDCANRYIGETARTITRRGLDSCGAKVLPVGSVLLSSRAPIGLVSINTVPMATNQGFKSLVPHPEKVNARYLAHWLSANCDYLQNLGSGATFKEISKAVVCRIKIPLPSLGVQRRIARILDAAEALGAKQRKALLQIATLGDAVFTGMFGDPATNPKQWPTHALGELAIKFSDGPFGSNLKSSHYTDEGIRVIRLQNVGRCEFRNSDHSYIGPAHFAALTKHECVPGDVIIATLGEPNLRACILPAFVPVALNKADCVQMRVAPARVSNHYVAALLNQPGTLALAQSRMAGQTRVRISMGRLRTLPVPVAPRALQEKFAESVESLNATRTFIQGHLNRLDDLFASLQDRAFKGEL